ncbi:hypothetical protein CPB83DRAFT_851460 [Crepidotus variabilis]|uniref:Uncharacterized protein n=1 Tax=Crepidotus variabilis TaxID=179855 RepID=A0A9P6EJH0_9AGAR|nr:hypothetical protein CPB83DRAFT_851460 [Crepidotus variabilis]
MSTSRYITWFDQNALPIREHFDHPRFRGHLSHRIAVHRHFRDLHQFTLNTTLFAASAVVITSSLSSAFRSPPPCAHPHSVKLSFLGASPSGDSSCLA